MSMKLQLRLYIGFSPIVGRIGGSKAFWCPKCKDERSFLNVGEWENSCVDTLLENGCSYKQRHEKKQYVKIRCQMQQQ